MNTVGHSWLGVICGVKFVNRIKVEELMKLLAFQG